MCLYMGHAFGEKIRKLLEKQGSIPVWKVFRKSLDGEKSYWFGKKFELDNHAYYVSNSLSSRLDSEEIRDNTVHIGIHVYLKCPPELGLEEKVMCGRAYLRDFVAASEGTEVLAGRIKKLRWPVAVFTKVRFRQPKQRTLLQKLLLLWRTRHVS